MITPLPIPFALNQVDDFLNTSVQIDHSTRRPQSASALAEQLDQLGLPQGSVVAIAVPDSAAQLAAFLSTLCAGLVPVLLPRSSTPQRVRMVASELGASAIVRRPVKAPVKPDFGITVFRHPVKYPRTYAPGYAILLTSGTSGLLSGCLHRAASLIENAQRHATSIGLCSADTILVNLPLNYSFALVAQALAAWTRGCRLALSGPPFTPHGYARALLRHKATVSSLTPSLVRQLLERGTQLPSTLRTLTVGGNALEAARVAELLHRYPALELYLTYGLTEAGPRVSTLAAHNEPPHRFASVGTPLPGVKVALEAAQGNDGAGELIVTSSTTMVRRVGQPPERGPELIGPDTLQTRDLFHIDEENYLYFQGRTSDFVVINGDKVSLRSVCQLVQSVPGVISARTEVTAAGSSPQYSLRVSVSQLTPQLESEVHQRIDSTLIRAELPTHVAFLENDPTGFTK